MQNIEWDNFFTNRWRKEAKVCFLWIKRSGVALVYSQGRDPKQSIVPKDNNSFTRSFEFSEPEEIFLGFSGLQVFLILCKNPKIAIDSGSEIYLFWDLEALRNIQKRNSKLLTESKSGSKIISIHGDIHRDRNLWFVISALSNHFSDMVWKWDNVFCDSLKEDYVVTPCVNGNIVTLKKIIKIYMSKTTIRLSGMC